MDKNIRASLIANTKRDYTEKMAVYPAVFKTNDLISGCALSLFLNTIWIIMYISFQLDVNMVDGSHWLPYLIILQMGYILVEFISFSLC